MAVRILTDSACDLPKQVVAEYGIDVVPLMVYKDDKEYQDGVTLKPAEMFGRMRQGTIYKTAQVPPGSFLEKFGEYGKNGDSCIYLAFSSELSGTHDSALLARDQLQEAETSLKLDIIDTKCASMGFGLVVYLAARMAKEGKSHAEIVAAAQENAQHMEHIFTVDDLEYLYRGGRVSRTAAFVGGILNIKPVLHVQDGRLIPVEKARGRKKAIKRMVEIMGERGSNFKEQVIGISHGDDLAAAEELKTLLEQQYGCRKFIINDVGCAIGAHSGPGTLALFFLNNI
ncbi:DegV family protein [Dethiobacter alkaliphilus]|uniref:DegV family protein n=1 Tax=Dethiobacter alkaliphilus TaxID=427926 RepID=UPI002225E1FE|nr:DegV family protein [Dethiobacter alkaliphilus]MCW3490932.1 DegV family protein [Dethiobacter alkaliphilus]